jgi:hypothetical protein
MESVAEIRRIASENPDTWIGKCFLRYLTGTPRGMSLDEACGLSTSRERLSSLREERLNYRNACILWYARYANARENLSVRAQAAAVHRAAETYKHGRWRFDQYDDRIPTKYFDTRTEILYRLFAVSKDLNMPVPAERQIRRLIGGPRWMVQRVWSN